MFDLFRYITKLPQTKHQALLDILYRNPNMILESEKRIQKKMAAFTAHDDHTYFQLIKEETAQIDRAISDLISKEIT